MTGGKSRTQDLEGIVAWRRMDEHLTTSGQPTEAQLADLKTLGVTHVINLGLHTHVQALPDERESLAVLGIAYIHIPVDFAAPSEADYQRFRATMQQLVGKTIHVHCIATMRVSAFLHRYRRDLGIPDPAEEVAMASIWQPTGVWACFLGEDDPSLKSSDTD